MTLIVEDGTGMSTANSYVAVSDVRAFATARGKTLPVADADVETLVIKAMDYVETFWDRFKGKRTTPDVQALSWPRDCADLFGSALLNNVIPSQLKSAVCQAAIEANTLDLLATITEPAIVQDTVGPITTIYSERNGALTRPQFVFVDALLKPLCRSTHFMVGRA